jgi:hypothetical protein
VRGDVRSDNGCFVGDRTVLVDWSQALRGHPHHDLTTALSTLPLEGGPDPFDVLPERRVWAAYHAGRSVRRAYRETKAPEWFPTVLKRIPSICLSWPARAANVVEARSPLASVETTPAGTAIPMGKGRVIDVEEAQEAAAQRLRS